MSFWSSWAFADVLWGGTVNHRGFFGNYSLGVFRLDDPHSIEFSVGNYSVNHREYLQLNFAYRYTGCRMQFGPRILAPLQFGVFLVRSPDSEKYFTRSPIRYPGSDYYDQTALRLGVEVGSFVANVEKRLGVGYYVRILDTGLISLYNNSYKHFQYYVSSGLTLRFLF